MGDEVTSPGDVAKVLEAADRIGTNLTPAEGLAYLVMDSLEPAVRQQMTDLLARLDNNAE